MPPNRGISFSFSTMCMDLCNKKTATARSVWLNGCSLPDCCVNLRHDKTLLAGQRDVRVLTATGQLQPADKREIPTGCSQLCQRICSD